MNPGKAHDPMISSLVFFLFLFFFSSFKMGNFLGIKIGLVLEANNALWVLMIL